MNKKFQILIFMSLAACLLAAGCDQGFLDLKRDKTQVVPHSLGDYQALLDNVSIFNLRAGYHMNVIGSDEYTVEDDVWDLLSSTMQKNAYIWASDIFEGSQSDVWNFGYERILYANTVLDGLKDTEPDTGERKLWRHVEGSALFMRAYTYYQMAQTFAPVYRSDESHATLGLPLRLEMDITMPVQRASLEDTYNQMIGDLQNAIPMLPEHADSKFRPTRPAAYALLSKIFLLKDDYQSALAYADSCLQIRSVLLDYNGLDLSLRYTFSEFPYGESNPEVLYMELIPGQTIVNSSRFCIDMELYNLYEEGDIRKEAFFFPTRETYTFKGSYTGSYSFFGGLAVDEVFLIRSECYTRLGNLGRALEDINHFLRNRYEADSFVPFTAQNEQGMLVRLLEERRKQLLCRGIRWEDLRRFNKEDAFQIVLTRKLKGETYTLPPDDVRYTWPIPDQVIRLSGIPQNPR
ncbi:RagB/SusD family nutrient uptake outer membrane protein [Parapedobacter sp. 10938]|uniref:RagB/SusD family nutrient uptake outer membrane protein n=1 Tax=Parapedobacter flavus TaxID=3110225 RepID=UPI002DB9E682|nr:RagB/SusD family nutrient uptake outer membrane protein [Parapedobacter sp. 10938]MEC3881613.1 RagB/SusD family nutrient uptake outer membrane protein [Parapedobacter sp. 10938]